MSKIVGPFRRFFVPFLKSFRQCFKSFDSFFKMLPSFQVLASFSSLARQSNPGFNPGLGFLNFNYLDFFLIG